MLWPIVMDTIDYKLYSCDYGRRSFCLLLQRLPRYPIRLKTPLLVYIGPLLASWLLALQILDARSSTSRARRLSNMSDAEPRTSQQTRTKKKAHLRQGDGRLPTSQSLPHYTHERQPPNSHVNSAIQIQRNPTQEVCCVDTLHMELLGRPSFRSYASTLPLVVLGFLIAEVTGLRMRMLLSGDDGACSTLDVRIDSVYRDTVTVSFAPPRNASKVRLEYYTGKFPTQSELEVEEGEGRASFVMTSLDPGQTYSLLIEPHCWEPERLTTCAGFADCRAKVSTEASLGYDCVLNSDMDYYGHDMIFGQGGTEAARRRGLGSPGACCDACAAVKPFRPYNDVCTHFVYEVETDTCYFKSPDAEEGREQRKGYVAGKVEQR